MELARQLSQIWRNVDVGSGQVARDLRGALANKLAEGRPLTAYLGVDPTSPHIHLGHTVPINKLRVLQSLGHRVYFVIGDFTAMIGDPSGRSRSRTALTHDDVMRNARAYTDQVNKLLDPETTEVLYNSTWLEQLSLRDVVKLASSLKARDFLDRNEFKERRKRGEPVYGHEPLYCLLQGFDAVHLEADIQVGGRDQFFNIMKGREIMRAYGVAPQVPVTTPLLLGTDGTQKMSKSYGNDIGVTEPPKVMFAKLMRIPDRLILQYFNLLTILPTDDINEIRKRLEEGLNPKDAKIRLAKEIVQVYYGDVEARNAEQEFYRVYCEGRLPTEMPEFGIGSIPRQDGAATIIDLVCATGLVTSRSKTRRLVEQGGIRVDGVVVDDPVAVVGIQDGVVIQIGKKRFARGRDRIPHVQDRA